MMIRYFTSAFLHCNCSKNSAKEN